MKESTKTVLCYGDSNTWGYIPGTGLRYSRDERWPGVLRRELGEGYEVIEEGFSGRTTVWDDPIEQHKNGKTYLHPCLGTHQPLDLVILMLGTNDLKMRFSLPACDIAAGAGVLVDVVQTSGAGPGDGSPKVLLIGPPAVKETEQFGEMLKGAEAKSEKFPQCFEAVAAQYGCAFLDSRKHVVPSETDGVHLEKSGHEKLGRAAAELVKSILA